MADKLGISNIIQLPWMSGVDAGQNERRPYFDFKANGCSAGWYIAFTNDLNVQQNIGFTIIRYDGSNVRNFLKDKSSDWQESGSAISCAISSWYASIRVAKLKFPDIFPVGGVILTLLLALSGAGARHERQVDKNKRVSKTYMGHEYFKHRHNNNRFKQCPDRPRLNYGMWGLYLCDISFLRHSRNMQGCIWHTKDCYSERQSQFYDFWPRLVERRVCNYSRIVKAVKAA